MDVGEDEFWMNSEPDEEEDAADSELENAYYEAKSLLQEGGTEASVRFQEVILMDEDKGKWGLKALRQLIKLACQQGRLEDAIEHHVQIIGYVNSVSGKAFEKALQKNLVDFSTVSAAHDEKKCLLEKFVDSMEPIKEKRPSVWCRATLGVGRHYVATKDYAQAATLTERVLDFCLSDDDGMRAGRHLPEVFELQARISYAAQDYDSVMKLRQRAQPYADALWSEKSISSIRELAGMCMLRRNEFSQGEQEFKDLVQDPSTVTTEERKRRVDSFVAAYFLRRCFDKSNATLSGSLPANKHMAIDDDVLEIAKDHMDRVEVISALVKALGDDDLDALEAALDASVGQLDSQLLAIFHEWHYQIRDLGDHLANTRAGLASGDLLFVHCALPKLEQLSRTIGGSSELRQSNHMMDILTLKACVCFEERNYELLETLCETANSTACTANKDLQRAAVIELYGKAQLRQFTSDANVTITPSSTFNDTFYAASKMYASAFPERAEMCALYASLVAALRRMDGWEQWATSSELNGPRTRDRQMVDECCAAYNRGDITTLSAFRTELAATINDTFFHEQLHRLESKLRRRLCLRTIVFPAETWTVVFEYLRHRECHAPHEVSRNFRNILAPILRHPSIPVVVEVSITSSFFGFSGCTAVVRTAEFGDKTSGGPTNLYDAIDFVAGLTSLHRVHLMTIDVDAYFNPPLLSAFCGYFGSVSVGRFSVARLDFRTPRFYPTTSYTSNEDWDADPPTNDWDDGSDTLRHFIDSLKAVDQVCFDRSCKISRAQANDALMLVCCAKGIQHLDVRCIPAQGPKFEVTDSGLIEFCLGGHGTGRGRYLSIRYPSISDEFYLHLHKAHQDAEHQDPFVLRLELDPHEIETIQKTVQQVKATTANLSPERDTDDESGGAMGLRVEYGLPVTDDPPEPSPIVTISRF